MQNLMAFHEFNSNKNIKTKSIDQSGDYAIDH